MEIVTDTRPLVLPFEDQCILPGNVVWVSVRTQCHFMLDRLLIPDPDTGAERRVVTVAPGRTMSVGGDEDFTVLAIEAANKVVLDTPRPATDFSERARWRYHVVSNRPLYCGETLRLQIRNDADEPLVFRATTFGRRIKNAPPWLTTHDR